MSKEEKSKDKHRKRLAGMIVSTRMQDTLVVEVKRLIAHPIYKKRRISSARYKVHYSKGEYKIGDKVEIEESRPLSKGKRWQVI